MKKAWSAILSMACFWMTGQSVVAKDFDVVCPLLAKYCVRCHGETEQNALLRFDRLQDFEADDQQLWALVHESLVNGEMPPKEEAQPTAAEKQVLLNWILTQAKQQVAKGASQRRLNRREFSAALEDLVALPIDFAAALPEDAKVDGFDTGATALRDAADSVAQWLEVTQRAVDSIRFLEPERNRRIQIDFREREFPDYGKFLETEFKDSGIYTRSKNLMSKKGIGLYLPTQWTGDNGNSFLAFPISGEKRGTLKLTLRVATRRPMKGLPIPILWVKVGGSFIDYRPIGEESQTLTYAVRLEDCVVEGTSVKVMLQAFVETPYAIDGFENDDRTKPEDNLPGGIGTYRPAFDRKVLRTPEQQPVPSIVVEAVDADFDHQVAWPPAEWQVNVGTLQDDDASARRLLALWIERAWRRPVTNEESEKFFMLYQRLRREGHTFDPALRAAFQAVLMGGPFRYLAAPSDPDPKVAQHALASRLSFMLIGAPPDRELRSLAAAGKLKEPQVLDAQVDRLLADSRSMAFFQPFATQWLNLNQPVTLVMSSLKKQDFRFGRHLKASMKDETIQYVARLISDNRPARELVSSDWTMMNDILSVHYGYPTLDGGHLRKVTLQSRPEDLRGGGILAHAGIQSMLCWMGDNWVIYRGSWVLSHVLDDPPPPPPLEVPELLPFDKANQGKSFRELLVQHQADSKCSVCHKKMDLLGFAFQNFDLSGRWRPVEHERYHRAELDGKIEWRGDGKTRPVDAVGKLPRGEEFRSFLECKELLATKYCDDIVRGLLKRLTLYGTGRSPDVLDLVTIRKIQQEQTRRDFPLRDVLKALIRSEVFRDR